MKHNWRTKGQRKAQEDHLEDVKPVKPANGTKSANQAKWKEELRKARNYKNS
jgi:hypothetical protein